MIALALTLALASPSVEGERRPALLDLAYALGEAHALRQACRGRVDGYWRGRMSALLAAETPTAETRLQLVARFNGGFAAGSAAHPGCDADTRAALADVLARAAPLAKRLARGD